MNANTADFQDPEVQIGVNKMDLDLRRAAHALSEREARFLVDSYYTSQKNRIRAGNQLRDLDKAGEPHEIVEWLMRQNMVVEQQIQLSLDVYSRNHPIGEWLRSVTGIGPVIAAGLLANVRWVKPDGDQRYETAGTLWRLAGLDPSVEWKKGARRPWNASLKTLCWKASDSFVKFSGSKKCVHGGIYRKRKEREIRKNIAGDFARTAREALEKRNFGRDTEARVWYEGRVSAEHAKLYYEAEPALRPKLLKQFKGEIDSGVRMLPPGRIDLRARRYAVKIFLSHFFEVGYEITHGEKPAKPFAIAILNHANYIRPPNWPVRDESAKEDDEPPVQRGDREDAPEDWHTQ